MSGKTKIIRCAECGEEIPVGEDYYSCDDNFLQLKYFDTNADNCFCSLDCLCNALSVGTHENDGNVEFGDEEESEEEIFGKFVLEEDK